MLAPERIRRAGLFDPAFVTRLVDEHGKSYLDFVAEVKRLTERIEGMRATLATLKNLVDLLGPGRAKDMFFTARRLAVGEVRRGVGDAHEIRALQGKEDAVDGGDVALAADADREVVVVE